MRLILLVGMALSIIPRAQGDALCTAGIAPSYGDSCVFTYQNGSSATVSGSSEWTAVGVDDAGAVLVATGGSNVGSPALLSGGTLTPINVGGVATEVWSISANGTVLGRYWSTVYNTWAPFTDLNGVVTTLSPQLGLNWGQINDEGWVAGPDVGGNTRAVYNVVTGVTDLIPVYAGATVTGTIDINDNGDVLGFARGGSTGNGVYFVDHNGVETALAIPNYCTAKSINNNEQIVGFCLAPNSNLDRGFLYDSGVLTYIDYYNEPNASEELVVGINDSGEVVGNYVWVPEPGTPIQLLVGVAFLVSISSGLRAHLKNKRRFQCE